MSVDHLGDAVAHRRGLFVDLESPGDVAFQRLRGFGLRGSVPGFTYLHRPAGFDLLDPASLERFKTTIRAHNAELVVIDSLRRAAPGLDENDSRQVSLVLSALRTLTAELHATVVLIHHPRKPVGEARVEALYAARGSGDLIGSADSAIFFRKLAGGPVRIEHAKARRGREHEHVHFRIVTNAETGAPQLEHVEPDQALANDELDDAVLAFVTEHPGTSTRDIENGVKGSRAAVRNSLARLAAPGDTQSLALGAGRHPSGKYWYPNHQATLLSPGDTAAAPGDTLARPSQAEVVAVSPRPRRGGDTSGDTFGDRETGDPEEAP